jgi:hypothetical protein
MLTDQARTLATEYAPDDVWLQDAMRHVTWSFLLTRAFGPTFATMVTDAQELRPGNNPDERAMRHPPPGGGRALRRGSSAALSNEEDGQDDRLASDGSTQVWRTALPPAPVTGANPVPTSTASRPAPRAPAMSVAS